MDIDIRHDANDDFGQYQLIVDGETVGELDHRDHEGTRVFSHTGVRESHQGRGLAARLVRRGLDDARAEGKRVVPRCWYVAQYIDEHPDYADLVAS